MMVAGHIYASQGAELVLEQTAPITREKTDMKRIEILDNVALYKHTKQQQ